MLGIPTVLDRFVQPLLWQVLTPIFEPLFSQHSYGFRLGRSAPDAVRAAQAYATAGKDWVVDIDIAKFFDCVHHDILMFRIGQTIGDKRVLKLVGRYLRSGVMVEGVVISQTEGTPQGGPRSPLLANLYLDPLDKELEKRGHCFARYADDCNIYVGSEATAHRLIGTLPQWIGKHLRLKVNASKSGVGRTWERKFLGFRINRDRQIEVSPESLTRWKDRVRQLWRGQQSLTSAQLRERGLSYIRGWWGYYQLAEWREPIFHWDGWIRRHIGKCFWLRWHNWRGSKKALMRLGIGYPQLKSAYSSRGAWRLAASPVVQMALNNLRLRQHGFLTPGDLAQIRA